MKTQSADSDHEDEAQYLEYLRKIGTQGRFQIMSELTTARMKAIRDEIRELNPGASEQELMVLFARRNYGDELANAVNDYLAKRSLTER